MARLRNRSTGVVVTIDDSKVGRYDPSLWEPADTPAPKRPAKRAAPKTST